MKRNVDLAEITDGKLYSENDLVRIDSHGCQNCHLCCTGMGKSIVLDPYDVWRIKQGIGKGLQELLALGYMELNVVDGCIMPNIKMAGEEDGCSFLNEEGRCSIHGCRPGVCRLFPLGRLYEDGDFQYILQIGECPAQDCSKVKIEKWIDTPNRKRYHDYICSWHNFTKWVEEFVKGREDSEEARKLNYAVLTQLYMCPETEEDRFFGFFDQIITQLRAIDYKNT